MRANGLPKCLCYMLSEPCASAQVFMLNETELNASAQVFIQCHNIVCTYLSEYVLASSLVHWPLILALMNVGVRITSQSKKKMFTIAPKFHTYRGEFLSK